MDDVKNKDLDQQRIFQPSGKEPRGKLNCYDWLADVPGEKMRLTWSRCSSRTPAKATTATA